MQVIISNTTRGARRVAWAATAELIQVPGRGSQLKRSNYHGTVAGVRVPLLERISALEHVHIGFDPQMVVTRGLLVARLHTGQARGNCTSRARTGT